MTLNSEKDDFLIKEGLWKGKRLYDLYNEASTPYEWHKELFGYANKIGITIFSSPFDELAVDSYNKNMSLVKVQAWFFPLMILLIGFSNLIVIYIGGNQYIKNEIDSLNSSFINIKNIFHFFQI